MSFMSKKSDITENRDDIDISVNKSDDKRVEPTDGLSVSATTSAQTKDITVANIKAIDSSKSCSQSLIESSDNQNNGLTVDQIGVKPILKRKSLDETEIKTLPSILKKRDSFDSISKQTILKRHSLGSETDQRNPLPLLSSNAIREIAISSTPSSSSKPLSQIHSILKFKSFDEKYIQSKEDQSFPKPILKKNLSIEESIEKSLSLKNGSNGMNSSKASPSHSNDSLTKSILKSGSEDKISTNKSVEMKSILKIGPKIEKNDSKPVKSALKKSDLNIDSKDSKVKSILKSESIGSNEKLSDTSSSSDDEDFDLSIDNQNSATMESTDSPLTDNNHNKQNGNSIPAPNCCAFKQNEENTVNQRFLLNNKRLDQKRPSSCIIMSTTKPIDIDIDDSKASEKEAIGKSISDRLAALKRNGEENWKKRVSKSDETEVELRPNTNSNNRIRSTSIADRLSLLEDSSLKWKNRVEEKDAKQFTIEAKMLETDIPIAKTPDVQRKTPKATPFRSEKTAEMLQSMKREPPIVPKLTVSDTESQLPLDISPKKVVVVSIPKSDDNNFNSFFSKTIKEKPDINETLSDDIFDEISVGVSDLLIQKKSVKKHNRRTDSNPIRRLAARKDFTIESYTETAIEGKSEVNPKPKKSGDITKSSSFAASALAGLASREDIKAVAGKLRSSSHVTRDVWKSYDMPNSIQNLMLVQIKGRRRAQTRLVEPVINSINSGDCYLLVTRDKLFVWIGQFSNIIERTKTLEIANQIQEKKDLCFRSSNDLILMDFQKNEKINEKINKSFFEEIKSNPKSPINPPKSPEEDEIYEETIIGTNMIYKVNNEQLVPFESYWGRTPKYEILTSDDAFVFDFGSEMYVWVGNKASNIIRKCALDSAKELWNKGYNYSECDVNPFGEKAPKKAEKRPHWTWFMKVSQNMESILFKDKFMDWPTTTAAVKSIPNEKQCSKTTESTIDVKAIMGTKAVEPDMILEASHLGRGVRWDDDLEGRHISITSLDVKCWHISEYEKHELLNGNKSYFYSGDTYVVRWHYRLSRVGRLLKSGDISRHSMIGRDRTCYFFWHGINTKNTEKGASALMTIELDKEKAQQVRVSERKEEPCFLNLFKGSFVILCGKRGQKTAKDVWKMFYIRGLLPNEASLVEVECKIQSLRSRTAFVFLNGLTSIIYVWNGSKCLEETRKIMRSAVENLILHKSGEIGLKSEVNYTINSLEEGKEDKHFWNIFQSNQKRDFHRLYYSLIDSPLTYSFTARLFNLSSSSGEFKAKEILCSFRSCDHINPYPFLQSDVYSAQQPTFFLFDNQNQIFLWESKFAFSELPIEDSEPNTTIGSVNLRWSADRRCALEFALDYCYAKNNSEPPDAYVVCAGLEPDSFCALFPEWKYREDVASIHIQDGRKAGEMVRIQELLSQLRATDSTHYSLKELRKRPEGLNPLCLESYLSAQDFKEALGNSREEFYRLPAWKQTALKQKAHLF